jgi:hypothetical protein
MRGLQHICLRNICDFLFKHYPATIDKLSGEHLKDDNKYERD